ncbi:MAG: HNH endonuclease [Solirubrobacterales bacterium]
MVSLVYPESHHVVFRSRGGGDGVENLMAVCPTCHRVFGHRLYSPQEAFVLKGAADEWRLLVKAERRMRRADSWQAAAEVVLDPAVRQAALLLGAYEQVFAWLEEVISESNAEDSANAALRCRLILLACEVCTYFGAAGDVVDRLDEARKVSGRGGLDRAAANSMALVEAKCCQLKGDVDGEEQALGAYVPPAGDDPEFGFRTISLALKVDRQPPVEVWNVGLDAAGSLADRMAVANIVGDRGRWLQREDRPEDAYRELARSFLMTRMSFHRRGMFVKAMLLSDLALQMGEAQMAADWWMIGDQFKLVGRNLVLTPEPLRGRITKAAGERAFIESGVRRASLARLVPPEVLTELDGSFQEAAVDRRRDDPS